MWEVESMVVKNKSQNLLKRQPTLKFVNNMQRKFFDYDFLGLEHVSKDKPTLFVGNHSIYAYDVAIFTVELKLQRNIETRALADIIHSKIPYWRDVLENHGVVPGTPENCADLMAKRQHILVFPGGAREAFKRRGEEHRLFWKRRTGFARLAMANKYSITPFCVYGADLAYNILWDYDSLKKNRILSPLLKKRGKLNELLRNGELFPPIAIGRYKTLLPKKTPIVFNFGKPISTARYRGSIKPKSLWAVREKVEAAVKELMQESEDYLREKKRLSAS